MPATTPTASPSPFLERLILFLMPYFLPVSPDEAVARSEILETLASYGGRSRAEVINAARVIAFSFAALDTLTEAQAPGLTPALRLRHRNCANTLNRSCQQSEQALARRLACAPPDAPRPDQEPANDAPTPEFLAAVRHVEASIASNRDRLTTNPSSTPQSHAWPPSGQDLTDPVWSEAMMIALTEMAMSMPAATP